jgi:hypothetical protein
MKTDQEIYECDRLKIPKGIAYESKNPKKVGKQIAKRTYTVLANTETPSNSHVVWWVGAGRYFCCADKKDIEFIGQ